MKNLKHSSISHLKILFRNQLDEEYIPSSFSYTIDSEPTVTVIPNQTFYMVPLNSSLIDPVIEQVKTISLSTPEGGDWEEFYRVLPHSFSYLKVSFSDVRELLGCTINELPDEDMDIYECWVLLKNTTKVLLHPMMVASNPKALLFFKYWVAYSVSPSLGVRIFKKETNGTNSVERNTLALEKLQEDLLGKLDGLATELFEEELPEIPAGFSSFNVSRKVMLCSPTLGKLVKIY